MEDTLSAILLGVILAFSVGPVFFMLLETSITKGFRAAISFDMGVICGDVSFISLAFFATNGLLEKLKGNPLLFLGGGLILLLFGAFSFLNEQKKRKIAVNTPINLGTKVNYFKLFWKGFFINTINIGVLFFWIGIIIVAVPRLEMDNFRIFLFFLTIILSYLVLDVLKIIVAKSLRNKLTEENIHKTKQFINIIIFVFGFILILQGLFPDAKSYISQQIEIEK